MERASSSAFRYHLVKFGTERSEVKACWQVLRLRATPSAQREVNFFNGAEKRRV
jgi:hypothetical protein